LAVSSTEAANQGTHGDSRTPHHGLASKNTGGSLNPLT